MSNTVTYLDKEVITNNMIIDKDVSVINYAIKPNENNLSITLKPNVNCTMVSYLHDDVESSFNLKVTVEENASFTMYNIVTSNQNVNIDINCKLEGKNGSFNNMSVILSRGKANCNSLINVDHLAYQTSSNTEIYAIAKDFSKIKIDNNASIKKGCAKSVAHQKAKGLTLNKNAVIKALPNLFIDEYDVIANHAASIGSLNPDDLFYLMSRGLTKEEASKIIISGFITPLVESINDPKTKKMILDNFMEKTSLKDEGE